MLVKHILTSSLDTHTHTPVEGSEALMSSMQLSPGANPGCES